jgi:hypothetical protein
LRYFFDHCLKLFLAASGLLFSTTANAGPWAQVGDNALRADIALLSSSGALNDVGGQWPLPWSGILSGLEAASLAAQPDSIQAAAQRVVALGSLETQTGFSGAMTLGATNAPSVVYGFDGMGRGQGQLQLTLDYNSGGTSARIAMGAFTGDFRGRTTKFMPDGSFLAQRLSDDVIVYGGWLSHWWGPGWISALALSNNARPMPQIGIQRVGDASSWPVLQLLGPWQAEFFVGLLDDPRLDRDTVYNAIHLAFNPLPGLEIGFSRTQQMCGSTHACVPLRDFLDFNNDPANPNATNDELQIDLRWSPRLGDLPVQLYTSLMNEDSSPFTNSGTSHLFGATMFLPMPRGTPLRLTLEYTDSVATADMFSFGDVVHGVAYNNGGYPDGMRYRGRTLGFSLDSDSRLFSLQGAWSDDEGRFYQVSLHRADISHPGNLSGNIVTSAPVSLTMGELRVSLPWQKVKLDLALRLQDDQPRPRSGFDAAFEIALHAPL